METSYIKILRDEIQKSIFKIDYPSDSDTTTMLEEPQSGDRQ